MPFPSSPCLIAWPSWGWCCWCGMHLIHGLLVAPDSCCGLQWPGGQQQWIQTAFSLRCGGEGVRKVKPMFSLSEACHISPRSQEAHKLCRASGPLSLGSPGSERPTEGFKYFIPPSFLQTHIATGADCLDLKWWSQIVIKFILYFPLLRYQGS